MATENVGFNVTVEGVEKTISSFKDLKIAIKAAKEEQIVMSEKFGATSVQAVNAGKKLAELKDKIGDLNDSTKTFTGSGVERLTSSFRLLSEGIATFDFDKIKTGFKGIGAAMGAIPIFLLIEGIRLLYQNFDKIAAIFDKTSLAEKALAEATKAVSGELAKVLEGVQNVESAFDSFNKGTLSKDETLKIYNETLGQSLGYTNDLAVAESNFVANKDLYIEAMQAKATANVLFAKSAEAQAKVLTGEAAGADAVPWYEKTYAYISSIGLNAQADMNEYAKKVVEYGKIHSKETQKFADETKKLGQTEKERYNALFENLKTNNKEAGTLTKEEFDKAEKLRLKGIEDAKAAAQKRLEDEKKLLSDIEKAKEESYIKTFKTEIAQAIVKAQFQNDDLIKSINSSKASQATKNKALAQAEITLQENYAQIQKDYKVKQEAIEKAAEVKRQADADKAITIIETDEKKKIALQLSNIESSYQLEAQRLANQGKNLQAGSQAEEENNAKKVELEKKHFKDIYDINIANADLLGLSELDIENNYTKQKEALEDAARERKKAKEKQLQKDIVESVNLAAQTTLAVSKTLSDTYYMKETQKINKLYADKLKNVKQGSKEEKAILDQKAKDEKDLARQQFETQKKFNRASAIMNGILGLGAIFAVPDPTLGIMSAVRAIALVATTAANVAQINSTQFDEGGSSAGGIPAAETSAPSTAQAPSIYGPGQGQSTTFSGNQNNNFAPVKAYVVETENRSTTNRVNKLVSESTYG
jgi:hypothetical protein